MTRIGLVFLLTLCVFAAPPSAAAQPTKNWRIGILALGSAITIRAATSEWLSEGELLVLTPQGGSTFKVAGRILPGLLDD